MDKQETEQRYERVKAQLDIVWNIIGQESSSFVGIGGLAIAIIVVLTLSDKFVFFEVIEGKILLTVLLFLIMVIMWTHFYVLDSGKKKGIKNIHELAGIDVFSEVKKKMTCFEKIVAYIPNVVMYIFLCTIAYVIIFGVWF